MPPSSRDAQRVLDRLFSLRQHQQDGRRSPHKPLLVLLALGRLATTGTSALPWSEAESQLADLLQEFGPTSRTGRAQSAAYPFTRLRADGVWTLDRDVPMDNVGPLREGVTGRLEASLEQALWARPERIDEAARSLVDTHFPGTVAPDVLVAVDLDPELLEAGRAPRRDRRRSGAGWPPSSPRGTGSVPSAASTAPPAERSSASRRRTSAGSSWAVRTTSTTGWPSARCTTSCSTAGCSGWTTSTASSCPSASPPAHSRAGPCTTCTAGGCGPVRGTPLPAERHVAWHREQVFQGTALAG